MATAARWSASITATCCASKVMTLRSWGLQGTHHRGPLGAAAGAGHVVGGEHEPLLRLDLVVHPGWHGMANCPLPWSTVSK